MSFFRKRWVVSLAGLIAVAALVALAVLAWDRTSPEDQLTQLATPVPTLQTAQQPPVNSDEPVFESSMPTPTPTPRPRPTSTPVDRQAQPMVTPVPMPTRPHPRLDVQPLVAAKAENTYNFNLVTMPRDEWFSTPGAQGELCEMDISPNGEWAAIQLCTTEGLYLSYLVNLKHGTTIAADITMISPDDPAKRVLKRSTWFRGWFPDSKRILRMSGWIEIFDITTGETHRLTPQEQTVTDASVSPDGKVIAYTTIEGDQVRFIDVAGNLLNSVSAPEPQPGVRPKFLSWSSDGRYLAFIWDQIVSQFNSYGPLWILEVESGKEQPLSVYQEFDSFPAWSPQSDEIVVVRRENMDNGDADYDLNKLISSLWIVDAGNGDWRQLTDLEGTGVWAPSWTPDGSAIVFMSNLSGQLDAWVINADGSGLQQLTFDGGNMPRSIGVVQ